MLGNVLHIIHILDSEENTEAILWSLIGSDGYQIQRDICFPIAPTAKSYGELVNDLVRYFNPKSLAVVECFCFSMFQQEAGQTVSEFVVQLKIYQLIVSIPVINFRRLHG